MDEPTFEKDAYGNICVETRNDADVTVLKNASLNSSIWTFPPVSDNFLLDYLVAAQKGRTQRLALDYTRTISAIQADEWDELLKRCASVVAKYHGRAAQWTLDLHIRQLLREMVRNLAGMSDCQLRTKR